MIRLSGRLRSSLIIGVQGIRSRKLRTLLSMISLFLGVLAVVVVGTVVPAVDGSAKPFVALLNAAGRTTQSARRRPITIPQPVRVGGGKVQHRLRCPPPEPQAQVEQ